MDKLVVSGGVRLAGRVQPSGSKNGALAIMAGALLAKGETVLRNVPCIADVKTMIEVMRALGVQCDYKTCGTLLIDATEIPNTETPYELVKSMRASFCVLGPVLARRGYAKVAMPGGCDIGARPVDFHVKGIQSLGAYVHIEHGFVEAECDQLRGTQIYLNYPSAGATQHLMTIACLTEGLTTIHNAAAEPEVFELANFLRKMGARISGAGTTTIRIDGVDELRGCEHEVLFDRMEAGTFAVAATMTGGDVRIENIVPEHVESFCTKLSECGAIVEVGSNNMRVRCNERPLATDIMTMPYPGFPTDLQQPFAAMLAIADGTSIVTENVYERRFKYVAELQRMGANIKQEGRNAIITGVSKLEGAQTTACDLRAGAALVCAALAAEGKSEITGVEHINRGYDNMVPKLCTLGAQIELISSESEREPIFV